MACPSPKVLFSFPHQHQHLQHFHSSFPSTFYYILFFTSLKSILVIISNTFPQQASFSNFFQKETQQQTTFSPIPQNNFQNAFFQHHHALRIPRHQPLSPSPRTRNSIHHRSLHLRRRLRSRMLWLQHR
jgi:hypothetical protein